MSLKFLWYIPNTVQPGHRGDEVSVGLTNLHRSTELARLCEDHGWSGALLGTGWGRPDTFTVATALVARTTNFQPLIAIRPGFWRPAHFASAAATLDQISEGRVLVNVVSGIDNLAAYGDREGEQAERYARTREFIQLIRRLWSEDAVTFRGEHFWVENSTLAQRPYRANAGCHPLLYFGGASPAAERVSATEADVQLFWGEPLVGIEERISRLKGLSESLGRAHPPLEFGLRVTTVVRETTEEAWHDAEQRVAKMEADRQSGAQRRADGLDRRARGQQRLLELAEQGEVLDTCLYTAPGKYGGDGAGTTWLVGSYDDVADALGRYRDLGVTHFVLSDTPYKEETIRVGDHLIRRLHEPVSG
jgi:alkanesulfonate monooxygenase